MSDPSLRVPDPRRARGAVRSVAAALLVVLALLAGGCASFPDASSQPWRDNPEIGAEKAPAPQSPAPSEPPPPASPPAGGAAPAPGPCVDPDPQVVATCLAPVSSVVTLPGASAALVAERTTGRILRVAPDTPPQVVATVPVDATGDGGLTGLALSPTYAEDQLIYAYATTAGGNAVLRIAQGDVPKPVLIGIPRGASGNRGAIGVEPTGTLLVATGDAGQRGDRGRPGVARRQAAAHRPVRPPGAGRPRPDVAGDRLGSALARRRLPRRRVEHDLGHRPRGHPGRPARRPARVRAGRGRRGGAGLDLARPARRGRVRRAAGARCSSG